MGYLCAAVSSRGTEQVRKRRHAPDRLSETLLLLDPDVEHEVAARRVPVDGTPVATAHDVLALGGRAVRLVCEQWCLQGELACARKVADALTIVSSVLRWCRVRCVLVARLPTSVRTPFGGLQVSTESGST